MLPREPPTNAILQITAQTARAIEGDDDHRHAKVVTVDAVNHGLNSGRGTADADTMR